MPPKTPKPTEAELEVLSVLWSRGPSTVRQVHEALSPRRDVGYTTILKIMQLMADKGLVKRDTSQRTHVYAPADSSSHTRRRLVRDLIDRAFDGSARGLILEALASKRPTKAETAELRALLDELEGKGR